MRAAGLHEKVGNQRSEAIHQLETPLMNETQVIYAEGLTMKQRNLNFAIQVSFALWQGRMLRNCIKQVGQEGQHLHLLRRR